MADEAAGANKLPATSGGGGLALPRGGVLDGFYNLNILRQLGLMVGLAAAVAIGFAVVLWAKGSDYRPLYSSLQHIDANRVIEVLQANRIEYKIDQPSGALLVEADKIFDARLKLADAGMPGDRTVGFELLDKEQPLGVSQFMETNQYRRSLEGELARTVMSISNVRNARVHLAVPQNSVFVRDTRKPSASVFVELFPGTSLKSDQVAAIANLVASSIPELTLKDVTVVDQKGNLLSDFDDAEELRAANKQLHYVHKLEEKLGDRINNLLRPVVGEGHFRAEVSVDVDFTRVEQAEEMYNPDLPAIRSEQTLEEQKTGASVDGGIPGALSNQPAAEGQAPEVAAQGVAAAGKQSSGNVKRQATRNFELDRTISYTQHEVGRMRRLTVAVVVDDFASRDADTGEMNSRPWTEAELERLTILIKDAVGFSAARGDSVNVVNSPFVLEKEQDFEFPEPAIWELPIVELGIKVLAAGLLILTLLFAVVRPVLKNLSSVGHELAEYQSQQAMDSEQGYGGESLAAGEGIFLPSPKESYEQQLNAVKGLVAEDPGRVAQVVKRWIAASD